MDRHAPSASRWGTATGARQSSLRSLNLATVVRTLYASPTPPSRADLASATGLTRSTVSRLVDELIAHGLVRELDPVFGGMRGRPAVPLAPARGTWLGLGLEVNISHVAARLVDLAGRIVAERIVQGDFAGAAPEPTLGTLAGMARDVLASAPPRARVAGAQLALPGLVDAAHGVLLRAPNLRWREVEPGRVLAREDALAGLELHLGNEADFAAVTVARVGPGRPSALTDFLYISGEVGIGSSLVNRGEVMTGRHGWAGEIGHVCVDPDGPPCACGARGCLEAFAGQHALTTTAGVPDTPALIAALAAGDPLASRTAERAASALGIALSGALNLLDVSQVVLGGHLGALARHLLPGIRAELDVRVLSAPFEEPTVSRVSLDEAPAALGAAYVALDGVLNDPAAYLTEVASGAD